MRFKFPNPLSKWHAGSEGKKKTLCGWRPRDADERAELQIGAIFVDVPEKRKSVNKIKDLAYECGSCIYLRVFGV